MREITIDLKKVLGLSETFASFTGGIVDSLHLLIALAATEGTYAQEILTRFGFTADVAKSYLIKTDLTPQPATMGPVAAHVMEYAAQVAESQGYPFCDTQHLLVSIAYHRSCLGGKVLVRHGIDYNTVSSVVSGMAYHKIGAVKEREQEPPLSRSEQRTDEKVDPDDVLTENGFDLTEKVRAGKIDKVIGREKEIERVLRILSRKSKRNPIIIGDPGVGKTSVVYGVAQRIAKGDVPEMVRGKRIFCLDLNSLVAGTRYRGELEEKTKSLFSALADGKTILFIDEMHVALSAGGSEGGLNVAAALKPVLAKNDISVIGATGITEYRRFIEADPAFERRFTPVDVEEMSEADTKELLFCMQSDLQNHYGLVIEEQAVEAAVRLSKRYVTERYLPDKAIDLIDEACSRKKTDDCSGDVVTERDVKKVLSEMKGIPLDVLCENEQERLKKLEHILAARVVGQNEALRSVSKAIRRSRSGIGDPDRPVGSFLFIGPTGVGKTETAKALAECLFGTEDALIRFDMSEYMDKNGVSRLIGAPPGYVGYESGGTLTDAVRRRPYSVVLFDEIEKADAETVDILLQILDDGRLTDGKGRVVNFKNAVVIMTGNVGAKEPQKKVGFLDEADRNEERKERTMEILRSTFRPEFLNRIDNIIIFNNLSKENEIQIANILVERLRERLLVEKNIRLSIDDDVLEYLAESAFDVTYGARPLKRKIESAIEDPISEEIIEKDLKNAAIRIVNEEGTPKIIITQEDKNA